VRAFLKKPLVADMAGTADVLNGLNPWGDGAMIAVTIVAGRRSHIAAVVQIRGMYAGAVVFHLRGGDAVLLHIISIGMASAARVRHAGRTRGGTNVGARPYFVHQMAVGAHGDFLITLLQALAVDAGVIPVKLIDPDIRVEFFHVIFIGMAPGAELRCFAARRISPVSGSRGFCGAFIHRSGVAAVTILTQNAFFPMNVMFKQHGRLLQRAGLPRMTGNTPVVRRRRLLSGGGHDAPHTQQRVNHDRLSHDSTLSGKFEHKRHRFSAKRIRFGKDDADFDCDIAIEIGIGIVICPREHR
jgi:hypothetical protein